MAVPSVTTVSPRTGPTGGRLLVQVMGQGFQLYPTPPPDPLTNVTPRANPPVQVLFGGVPGTDVAVVSDSRLFVASPRLDPVEVETPFTADAGTDVLTSAGHGLAQNTRVVLKNDGGALPTGLHYPTWLYVVNPTANDFQLALQPNGAAVDFTDDGTGAHAAVSFAPVDVEVRNVDQSGALIPGETTTAAGAFTPLRPDLLAVPDFTRVVRELIVDLRRQVVANVDLTTNTDFDSSTGDGLDVAELSAIPGLVLAGPVLRENRFYSENRARSAPHPSLPGAHLRQRPAYTVDLVFTVIGVTDSKVQQLALMRETMAYVHRNKFFRMRRDGADPSSEELRWEMEFEPGGQMRSFGSPNNSNIRSFSGTFVVRGFDLDENDMAEKPSRDVDDVVVGGENLFQLCPSTAVGPSPGG